MGGNLELICGDSARLQVSQMNGIQLNGNKSFNNEKPVPGCLGRMVNIFDLTSGVSRNKLLTDKPHRDGSPLSRSRSDVSRMSSPISEEIEDKMTVSEVRRSSSSKKSEGTPVKMLIAEEMSKDMEFKQSSPNVVAKLMGLDALPQQQLTNLSRGRTQFKCHQKNSYSEIPVGYWRPECEVCGDEIDCDIHQCPEQYKYKDIYEIWEPTPRNCSRDAPPPKESCNNDNNNERQMAFVRQTFMEAKRLSTDEKLRQTKEFQDALEVLSSNKDLFLKVLQEPNSLVSHRIYGGQSMPPHQETKRITVLRPSKLLSDQFPSSRSKGDINVNKQVQGWESETCGVLPAVPTWKVDGNTPAQPTRIVVLKPTAEKIKDVRAVVSSAPSSPRNPQLTNLYEAPEEDHQAHEAREVSMDIMPENLASHRRDETLLSSVFSNGYIGDESSFNKSEAEFVVENLSDSEIMSMPSRYSWDYVNRFGSPHSCSSPSHASFSPESSVCREAKKRLSERWAMMASAGSNGEQKQIMRSSSTLGEMLALSDMKKLDGDEVENLKTGRDSRASTSGLASNSGECEVGSPRNLPRSKSLPASATSFSERLNVEGSGRGIGKTNSHKEASKSTTKLSFKGKVTSLFFSKNKKSSKEKSDSKDEAQSNRLEVLASPLSHGSPLNNVSKNHVSEASRIVHPESEPCASLKQAELPVSKPTTTGTFADNQGQPSPISVLDPPFEEDTLATLGLSNYPNQLGKQTSFLSKSNLIEKSPPIGSISRTLSWEEPCAETATSSDPLKSSFSSSSRGRRDDEGEWHFLVHSLLSLADLQDEAQLISTLPRWHSADSPLGPLIREKYINLDDKEPLHEAKRRHLTSNRKLVFDYVNAALVDIVGNGSSLGQLRAPYIVGTAETRHKLEDRVWAQVKEWFLLSIGDSEETNGGLYEEEDVGGDSLVVERVMSKELLGRGWADQIRLEMGDIGKEIEGKLLEELVEESVCEWTR